MAINDYLTIVEVAKEAGVTRQTVYKYINRNVNGIDKYVIEVDNKKKLKKSVLFDIFGIEECKPVDSLGDNCLQEDLQKVDKRLQRDLQVENAVLKARLEEKEKYIELLQSEKDRLIEALQQQIENLQIQLDSQTKLNLLALNQTKQIEQNYASGEAETVAEFEIKEPEVKQDDIQKSQVKHEEHEENPGISIEETTLNSNEIIGNIRKSDGFKEYQKQIKKKNPFQRIFRRRKK